MQPAAVDCSSLCTICLDRATGRHYGANSCDGCKGFFRRTIRKRRTYICRFNQICVVDRDHRNTCRRCRFEKCLISGMRKEAVQLERDRIASSRVSVDNNTVSNDPEIEALLRAEEATRQLRHTVITRTEDARRPATTDDVTESMHQQLILMVEWAKHLDSFRSLPLDPQMALLRHFSAQHLVFCAAFRSINVPDAIWLTNDTCLHRHSPKIPDVNRVAWRILDHLSVPMKRLHLDDVEYVCLKAIAFFDPLAKGVQSAADAIEASRQQLLGAFERHVTRVSPLRDRPQRLANLLLLLPPMLAIARDLVEDVQLARLFGLADIDTLMQELMIPEEDANSAYATEAIHTIRATVFAKSILKSTQ